MTDLDLNLINEFKRVPAFYNRKSERFKDKEYVDRAWKLIGRKLCCNVNMLKERMYQLRNRYNLENRKLQAMREDGVRNPKPLWPLFHNLNFLNGHIKQRKSYKKMKSKDRRYNYLEGFRGFTEEERKSSMNRSYLIDRNVDCEVKKESDDIQECESDLDMANSTNYLGQKLNVTNVQQQNRLNKTSQTLKNINILKQSLLQDGSDGQRQRKIAKNHHRSDKFVAFGSFVNASLQDLPQDRALVMIDRFTSEIVRALTRPTGDSSNASHVT